MPERTSDTLTEAVENFLKAVYSLQHSPRPPQAEGGEEERVSTNTLSEALQISAPSVTDMAQRLTASGLLDYQKYHGVMLTPAGEAIALKVLRRHRLIELYLVNELGYQLHEVHWEAEQLEHAVSDRFIEAIARRLGDPDYDPHGDPIPTAEGTVPQLPLMPLSQLPQGVTAQVSRLKTHDPTMLQHIVDRGFHLQSQVEVLARDPFEGPITARVDNTERVVGYTVAECILVAPDED